MNQRILRRFKKELPEFMGFGFLDDESIVYEDGHYKATYLGDFLDVVHTVEFDQEYYSIKHQERKKNGIWSCNSSLQKSFLQSFLYLDLSKDLRFKQLQRWILKQGNFQFNVPPLVKGESNTVTFPAGIHLNIHVVFTMRNKNQIDQIYQMFDNESTNITSKRIHILTLDMSFNRSVKIVSISASLPN